ncbi:MAG TPA: PorV/PorQ family protein [bacterium]|nr:PorV/PorQ family protein [bacterium]HQG46379.1 PorV/PorQ family protein [bacterium]HQI49729.1 PorV/PorQ family protein [bacterium]HQJ65740.1 PorV/PorQ family protein [bacterium]
MIDKIKDLMRRREYAGRAVVMAALLALLMAPITPLQAQKISGVGTSSAAFLKIGVGARALGMGEAYSTQAEDITAMFWNPAGLAKVDRMQILLNHYDYLADMKFEYAGFTVPMRNLGTFGVFFSYLGMPDIERTTITYPDGNGEMVSASSFAAGISYARSLTDRFSIGGTGKLVHESIWHDDASGLALDIGVQYRTFFKNLKIGMSISNFGGDLRMQGRDMLVQHDIDETSNGNNGNINAQLSTDEFPLPILFRVGLSANLAADFFGLKEHDLIVAVDAIHPSDNKEYLNVGAEYTFKKFLSLRSGYRQLFLQDSEGGLTFGMGLHARVLSTDVLLDYALIDYGILDRQNKFSLILSL